MKALAKKIENLMMAVTFAEAGEHETAREIMRERERPENDDRPRPSQQKVLRASTPQR